MGTGPLYFPADLIVMSNLASFGGLIGFWVWRVLFCLFVANFVRVSWMRLACR